MPKKISILGSTGSIGVSTVDIIKRHPDRYQVVGLAAGTNLELLSEQIKVLHPLMVSVKSAQEANHLRSLITEKSIEIVYGESGLIQIATLPAAQMVISAVVGAYGLKPTLAAIQQGKNIGLANKESMVIAGELMASSAKKNGVTIFPIDSEHSALFQCLEGHRLKDVRRLILTASGGPFFKKPHSDFLSITIEEALKHPNWNMGPKITIDSATMMNKGLEVMEARWLFDMPVDKIDVLIHPQSIVHSMVDFIDGSMMAHLGLPDMRVPIAYALSYPERIETGVAPLNLFEKGELTFFAPDHEKFPAVRLAFEVARLGQTYPAVLNAANEVAVEAFLSGKISFVRIPKLVEEAIRNFTPFPIQELKDVLKADQWAREFIYSQLR